MDCVPVLALAGGAEAASVKHLIHLQRRVASVNVLGALVDSLRGMDAPDFDFCFGSGEHHGAPHQSPFLGIALEDGTEANEEVFLGVVFDAETVDAAGVVNIDIRASLGKRQVLPMWCALPEDGHDHSE